MRFSRHHGMGRFLGAAFCRRAPLYPPTILITLSTCGTNFYAHVTIALFSYGRNARRRVPRQFIWQQWCILTAFSMAPVWDQNNSSAGGMHSGGPYTWNAIPNVWSMITGHHTEFGLNGFTSFESMNNFIQPASVAQTYPFWPTNLCWSFS